jgi:DNA-binding NtrC family response regulator
MKGWVSLAMSNIGAAVSNSLFQTVLRGMSPVYVKPLLLLIEDDPQYLTLRKKVLEREGYNVISVTSADDALKVLREAPVCATIADHMLQGTTGTKLAKEMKKIKADVPVILFSGANPQSLNGVDVFINKGEPTAEFLKIVREVVERYRS